MTALSDRQELIVPIRLACDQGARLFKACEVAEISLNDWYRWQKNGAVVDDARPLAERPVPANKLSQDEQEEILSVCNRGCKPEPQKFPSWLGYCLSFKERRVSRTLDRC
ncbi:MULTISPECIES: hypothetical protein [unclassified Undibacterium]|uniref:hypothetical protein n=1 Tax=unclassified Undibacterium TaxID=2630295 RepID=UPI002B23B77B|nr:MULTISPECIES: hypothetical protein [unclassified Undibacterium]MEB0176367.1 hypothetical protein [Undibacterium sp. CCC3.4]MEB0215701.1 hypothetical protein [Undibacterium sp. 5I2]